LDAKTGTEIGVTKGFVFKAIRASAQPAHSASASQSAQEFELGASLADEVHVGTASRNSRSNRPASVSDFATLGHASEKAFADFV
jgi:hypothetical protein